jgi:hypothetical protein
MVYYQSFGTPGGEHPATERAAVITAVHDASTVDLAVFNPTGLCFNQHVTQGDQGGQWDWMPFQKDQAARLAAGTRDASHPAPPVAAARRRTTGRARPGARG